MNIKLYGNFKFNFLDKIAENGNDENDDDEKLASFQTDFEEHNPKIINLKYKLVVSKDLL